MLFLLEVFFQPLNLLNQLFVKVWILFVRLYFWTLHLGSQFMLYLANFMRMIERKFFLEFVQLANIFIVDLLHLQIMLFDLFFLSEIVILIILFWVMLYSLKIFLEFLLLFFFLELDTSFVLSKILFHFFQFEFRIAKLYFQRLQLRNVLSRIDDWVKF